MTNAAYEIEDTSQRLSETKDTYHVDGDKIVRELSLRDWKFMDQMVWLLFFFVIQAGS